MHNYMKRLIAYKNISKKELSEKMYYSIAHINYVLSGKRIITDNFYRIFCNVLEVHSRHFYNQTDFPSQVLKTEKELIYLSAPYSHKDPKIVAKRAKQINIIAGEYIANGFMVFSPIPHCHIIAKLTKLPTDFEFWKTYNREMLLRCDRMHVLRLKGWKKSVRIKGEIKMAEELGIPIEYPRATVRGIEIGIED